MDNHHSRKSLTSGIIASRHGSGSRLKWEILEGVHHALPEFDMKQSYFGKNDSLKHLIVTGMKGCHKSSLESPLTTSFLPMTWT